MGWIVLIGAAYVLYAAAIRTEEWATVDRRYPRALLTIFGLSLFAAWSPVDFWYYLPSSLYITQFPYRMMEHVMWSGALLCAYALAFLFGRRQISDLALLMALLIVAASHGTWLNITNLPPRAVDTIATESVSHLAYIYRVDSAHPARLADVRVDEVKPNCKQDGVVTRCTVTSRGGDHRVVQLPAFYYPNLLAIKVNGSQVDYFPVLLREPDYVLAGVEIGPGESRIEIRFTGSRWANWVSATALAGVVLVAAFVGLRAGRRWSGRRSEHGAQRPS
jgi:hypothetical protein